MRPSCKATTTLRVNYVRLFINNNIRRFILNHYRFFDTQQFFYSFRKLFRIFQVIEHCLFHLKHLVVKYNINGDVRNRTKKIHRREITLRLSPPCEAEASKNIIKYKESSVRLPHSADNTILAD